MNLTPQIAQSMSPGPNAARIIQFTPYLNQTFAKYQINTSSRIAAFMAEGFVESAYFTNLKENTSYTLKRAMQVWPYRFNPDRFNYASNKHLKSVANLDAINYVNLIKYLGHPDTIINRAYAGKNGNSTDESVGDGLKYMGRGIFQVTGKGNYQACGKSLSIDLVNHPELLEQPLYACLSAGWFWSTNRFNALADRQDIDTISRKINGGDLGISERRNYFLQFKSALEAVDTSK